MRLLPQLVIALAAVPAARAVDQKKSAIVYFDNPGTPDSVIDQAKESIIKAGGKITHVYSIIRGFAVIAPEKALESVQSWGTDHSMRIEEDQIISSQ